MQRTFFEKHGFAKHPARQFYQLAQQIVETLGSFLCGCVVVGSIAHKFDTDDLQRDVDILLIADIPKWTTIMTSPYFSNSIDSSVAVQWAEQKRITMIGIRNNYKGMFIDAKLMSLDVYEQICRGDIDTVTIYREEEKEKGHILINFSGSFVEWSIENLLVPQTSNYVHDAPVFRIIDGRFYSGSLHNQLFGAPLVLLERSMVIRRGLTDIREFTTLQFLKECPESRDPSAILKILIRQNDIPVSILNALLSELYILLLRLG